LRVPRASRRLILGAVFAVLLVAGVAAPGYISSIFGEPGDTAEATPIDHVPDDDAALGLIHGGLVPARKGEPCVGKYRTVRPDLCSHGPDGPPAGLDVKRDVTPVAPTGAEPAVPRRDTTLGPTDAQVAQSAGAVGASTPLPSGETTPALVPDANAADAAFTMGAAGVACVGDGVTGKRVQVMYVHEVGTPSRYAQYLESFRTWTAGVDALYAASAQQTGGTRHVRFVTTADCKVPVEEVEVPAGSLADFNRNITAVQSLGYNRGDRKYLMFVDSKVYCGIGTMFGDDRTGANNHNNGGSSYARADAGCWTAGVAAHELGHNLGAVQGSAPHATRNGHCWDDQDLMCYNDGGVPNPPGGMQLLCPNADANQVDCNHDDYYNTNPPAGSYLATHWNVAENDFLIKDGGGTTPPPSPSPSVKPSYPPPPTGTPGPSTSATPSPTNAPLKPLKVTDVTSSSARLAWDPAAAGSQYTIQVNGHSVGTVKASGVTLAGMRPDTEYKVQIVIGSTPYTKVTPVKTKVADAPRPGGWGMLTNALTGEVADLYGARAADGTPLILARRQGGASQQWQLAPVGSDGYLLKSKATGKCVAPVGGTAVEGATLVEAACDTHQNAQLWRLVKTAYGFTLTNEGLVIGVGNVRYGDSRMLVLQKPNQARYQSWTVS